MISQDETLAVLKSFLVDILPSDFDSKNIVQAQDNRVPVPKADNFIVMTPIMRERISVNYTDYFDAVFTASIAATVMNITAIEVGSVEVGRTIWASGLSANTKVIAQLTGAAGGIGTYTISPSQTKTSRRMSAGKQSLLQPIKLTVQCDIFGDLSPDFAHIITTVFRSEYAADFFKATGKEVAPLFTSNPKQFSFSSGEQQILSRWTIDITMQVNPVFDLNQQFFDTVVISFKDANTIPL